MTTEAVYNKQSLDITISSHELSSMDIPKKIQVLDADLSLIDTQWVKSNTARLQLAPGIYVIKLVLSSGKEQQKAVEMVAGKDNKLFFDIAPFSPRESQEWMYFSKSSSGINPESARFKKEQHYKSPQIGISAKLWTYDTAFNKWKSADENNIFNATIDEVGMTYNLSTDQSKLQMLQIISNSIPWRCVSLPPGHNIRCLIKLATGPEKVVHPLDITVATYNTTAETLLSLLTSGRIDSAKSLCNSQLAVELLYGKTEDPAAAAIGGYYLLKVGDLTMLRNWPRNLANWMPWLPDGLIIHAWQMIREGNENPAVINDIRGRLIDAAQKGVPVYTEGLRLLYEGLNMLWYTFNREDSEVVSAIKRVKKYIESSDMSQETVTFSGASPDQPGYDTMGTGTGQLEAAHADSVTENYYTASS